MSESQEIAAHAVDLLSCFGVCDARRMFGGYGIFHQGLMISLIADGVLYLKADAQTKANFETENLPAFSYLKKDRVCELSYFTAPEAFFDDEEVTVKWAQMAYQAALRSPRKKKTNN